MSSLAMKSTVRKNGVEVTRLRIIPKNKYSKMYQEHEANIKAGKRPPQDCFESETGMKIESVTTIPESHATANPR